MGNCSSRNRHHAIADPPESERRLTLKEENSWKRPAESETSATETDREADLTMPLSPDPTLPLFEDSPSSVPLYSPEPQSLTLLQNQLAYSSLSIKKRSKATSPKASSPLRTPSSTSPRRQGRALQMRLEKARSLQLALANSGDGSTTPTPSPKRRPVSPATTPSSSASVNDEFEASLSSSTIWAEFATNDKVSSVALSRRLASLDRDTPPLYIAVGQDDGMLSIVEIADEQPLPGRRARTLGTPLQINVESKIRSLDFSPDGYYLAVGGDDCCCTIVRLVYESKDDEETLVQLQVVGEVPRIDRVYCVQFSPDNRYLAIGGFDGTVAICARDEWAHSASPEVSVEIPRDGLVFCLDWSPDSRYLAVGGSDKTCALIDVRTSWNVFCEIRRSAAVQAVQWYPNTGKFLAIGSSDVAIVERKTLGIRYEVDVASMQEDITALSGRSRFKVGSLAWSPNGTYFVVAGTGKNCTMLETKSFTPVHEMQRSDSISCLVWGQQSIISGVPRRYLCIGGDDHKVAILKAGLEFNSGASSICDDLSSSASSLFSPKSDWTLKENVFRDVDEIQDTSLSRIDNEDRDVVVAVAFSRGSKSRPSTFFAYALEDGRVVVRSTMQWKIVAELRFAKMIKTLSFSMGSRYLVLGSADARVYVMETAPSWSLIAKKAYFAPVNAVAYSRHNERLAVGTDDGILSLLDPEDNYKPVGEIDSSDSAILSIEWTSKFLAIGRVDGSFAVYEAPQVYSNFCVPLIDMLLNSPVRAVAFGPSSRFLAVAGQDGLVNIYSSKSGWPLCHQVRGPTGLSSLAWNASGRFLSMGGENGSLQMVDTVFWADVEEARALASCDKEDPRCTIASMDFSQDGTLLAFTSDEDGARVIDTFKWNLAFALEKTEAEPQLVQESTSDKSDSGTEQPFASAE